MDPVQFIKFILIDNGNGNFTHRLILKDVCTEFYNIFRCEVNKMFVIIREKCYYNLEEDYNDYGGWADYDIVDKIFEMNHYISGGFLLSCLYDEEYNSDIDILTNLSSTDVKNCLKANSYHICLNEESQTIYVYPDAFSVVKYQHQDKLLIDYIVLRGHNTVKEFVSENYDFNFCKVLFNGKKLWIYDSYAVANKICTINGIDIKNKELQLRELYGHYNGRGGELEYKKYHISRDQTSEERIKKYTGRGFTINIT